MTPKRGREPEPGRPEAESKALAARRRVRDIPVSVAHETLGIDPLVVDLQTDLVEVLRASARHPSTRLICVVDEAGKAVGVIPISKVAISIVTRISPEALLADTVEVEDLDRFAHAIEDRTAANIMEPPATIAPSASVADAFRRMRDFRVSGLYVIDEEGRPTGYLDMLELAIVYADVLQERPAGTSD
jgi:CBS domain-containing protein